MNLVVDCISVNEEKLEEAIERFKKVNKSLPQYLIMSKTTKELMGFEDGYDCIHCYWGIEIATCNSKKLGEVELI